jgi:hypothetical protein
MMSAHNTSKKHARDSNQFLTTPSGLKQLESNFSKVFFELDLLTPVYLFDVTLNCRFEQNMFLTASSKHVQQCLSQ